MCPFSAKGLLPYHKGSLGVLLSNPSVCWLTYGIVQVASCKQVFTRKHVFRRSMYWCKADTREKGRHMGQARAHLALAAANKGRASETEGRAGTCAKMKGVRVRKAGFKAGWWHARGNVQRRAGTESREMAKAKYMCS